MFGPYGGSGAAFDMPLSRCRTKKFSLAPPGVLAYHPLFDENFSQRQRSAMEPWLAWAPERTGTDPDGHMAGGAWTWSKCAVVWLSYSKHNARFVVKYLQ